MPFPMLHDQTLLSVIKLEHPIQLPHRVTHLFCLSVCHDEITLIAPEKWIAQQSVTVIEKETGWQALKINQRLVFSDVGVLSQLTQPLAEAEISVFVISTFNTDYLLIKQQQVGKAIAALRHIGCAVQSVLSFS